MTGPHGEVLDARPVIAAALLVVVFALTLVHARACEDGAFPVPAPAASVLHPAVTP